MSAAKALIYLALWAALIALCSYLAPYCGNDLRYMLIEGTDDLVNSVGDVFISQYRHYFDWGGRTVNHVIAQLLLYLDKPGQSIIQGLTFALLVWAIAAAGAGRWRVRQPLYPLIFITLMLWLCLRNFGEVVINMVSSANYLYSTLLVLIFLIPFRQSLRCAQDKRSWAFALQMFPLGIIAGWTNENTGFAAVCMVGLYNLRLLYEKRLTAWQFTGGVGLLIGYVLLMAAPGNEARMEFMEDKGFNFWDHFIHNSLEIVGFSFITQHLLLILNKTDRVDPQFAASLCTEIQQRGLATISLSARTGDGVTLLIERLKLTVDLHSVLAGDTIVSNARHQEALLQARDALLRALDGLSAQLPADLLSEDIRQVVYHIGTITGAITNDEVLGQIFSKFCIGK